LEIKGKGAVKKKKKMIRVENSNALGSFVRKLIKVVYTEDGVTKIRKGRCLAADSHFITVETYRHIYGIPRASVAEIKTLNGDGAR
jgi:hypothetical protein